jgi:hypothetical protein
MRSHTSSIHGWVAIFLLILSVFLIGWSSRPLPHSVENLSFPSLQSLPSDNSQPGTALKEEPRLIKVDIPERVRMGESDEIRLSVDIDESEAGKPAVGQSGEAVTGPDAAGQPIDEVYQIVAEARLELAGMQISPQDTVSEPLVRGRTVAFRWKIIPPQAGTYRGKLWLFVNLIPKDGGTPDRRPLLAMPVEIEGVSVNGIAPVVVRIAGLIGLGVSLGLGVSIVYKRLRKSKIGQIM